MNRTKFRDLCLTRPLILDGATGTELIKQGLPNGVSPEFWVYENPQSIINVQKAYKEAGSDIVYVPTFGGNRAKLAEFGLDDRLFDINRTLCSYSREAVR